MQEVIDNIIEKISFDKKEAFSILLKKCIYPYKNKDEEEREQQRRYKSVVFKMDHFFKNFSPFINEFGKDKKYESGVEALFVIGEELGIEITRSECFILFHLRNSGKFKIKESKLLSELKTVWPQYKHYALDDNKFSAALRNLRDERAIDYRKRNLRPSPTVILRYK